MSYPAVKYGVCRSPYGEMFDTRLYDKLVQTGDWSAVDLKLTVNYVNRVVSLCAFFFNFNRLLCFYAVSSILNNNNYATYCVSEKKNCACVIF